jgi:phage terminase large subunit-like protein
VARRRKKLVDLARDATFLARKDERLLGAKDKLPWPELEKFRRRYRKAQSCSSLGCSQRAHEGCRYAIALELETALREPDGPELVLGSLADALKRLGRHRSFEQLVNFFPWALRHQAGPAAGKAFKLADFQREWLKEWSRRDRKGERIYSTGLFGAPKGNGKTPIIAGLGLYALVTESDAPEIYDLAGAKDQADIAHEFARHSVEQGPLAAWVEVGSVITCEQTNGELEVLSAAGDLGHGTIPTAAFFDEKWLFRHREQREAVNAQEKALHKRPGQSYALSFTTAGWTKDSLLGEEYDALLEHPKLERRKDGFLLVVRDEEAGYLGWWHGAPDNVGEITLDVLRKANPAPWVRPSDLLKGWSKPGADVNDLLRLHANRFTSAKSSWLSTGIWDRLRSKSQIPVGAEIVVGIDAARNFDTTAVGWAWIAPDGRKILRSHVWSVRRNVPHDQYVEGGELVNEELVEPFIEELAQTYRIRGIAFDPRYFSAEARHLANAGHVVVEIQPQGGPMGDAVVQFEKDALAGDLEHSGDRTLALHIEAIESERRPDGAKKIGKRSDSNPIDAGISVILANYLTTIELPEAEAGGVVYG